MIRLYIPGPDEFHLQEDHTSFSSQIYTAVAENKNFTMADAADNADFIIFKQDWGFKNWDYRTILIENDFVRAHSSKFIIINRDDNPIVFFPGFYSSLKNGERTKIESLAFPYWSTLIGKEFSRKASHPSRWLWYFRGAMRTHPVRRTLYSLLKNDTRGVIEICETAWNRHSNDEKLIFAEGISSSNFALCPRGEAPSSYRLIEAMQLGVTPVIISDAWAPPLEIPWQEFSIHIKERDINNIPSILESHLDISDRFGKIAYQIWSEFFSENKIARYFLQRLEYLIENTWQYRSYDELVDIWCSNEFSRVNGWDLFGRARSKFGKRYAKAKFIYFCHKQGVKLTKGNVR